jgi:hypothetical protein
MIYNELTIEVVGIHGVAIAFANLVWLAEVEHARLKYLVTSSESVASHANEQLVPHRERLREEGNVKVKVNMNV